MCHSKYSLAVCILGSVSLLGCTTAHQRDQPLKRESALAAVHQYVSTHRHWPSDAYTVKQREDFGQYHVYDVINFDDYKRRYQNGQEVFESGRGKSFELYYEPRTGKIVKEIWFQ